ncbi:PepSY-associated TM helix domain-containing protein [Bowmanella denitrificans]|uniref:PepSY-associated TM helix domain-containing protein n=1 Tax=Bowmanella denitrificans TaxID=366582 RepID=UPI000C9C4F7F|nr:PepSY-associated TM helix domain-containing protein [Bowmanella denitrificans]
MRGDILKTYKTLHTWTGLIGGMALFICFFAGALTMFKPELDRWVSPPVQQLPWVEESRLSLLVEKAIAEHPQAANSFTLHVQHNEGVEAPMSWRIRSKDDSSTYWLASLDADNRLMVRQHEPSQLAHLVDMLHQTAGIPGEGHHMWGVYVMGAVCFLYGLALLSGVILLLPSLVKDFLLLRRQKTSKRFWLDAHNVIGITSLPFHILIAWTVVVFAFHDQIYDGLEALVYQGEPAFARAEADPDAPVFNTAELLMPTQMAPVITKLSANFQIYEASYSRVQGNTPSVRIAGSDKAHMVRAPSFGFVSLQPYTGEVLDKDYLPGYEDGWLDMVIAVFALHFGSYGGDTIRWVYFMLGLSGAFIFYSGNLLWIESRRRKQREAGQVVEQQKNARLMASATVGVCWGSVAGVALAMSIGKWVSATGGDANSAYLWVYYLVFLSALAWAFICGPAKGAVHILVLCALACLSIVLSALAAWLIGPPHWWHAGLAMVEVTALLFSLIFANMAIKMHRRARCGPQDSVWAYAERPVATELPAGIKPVSASKP